MIQARTLSVVLIAGVLLAIGTADWVGGKEEQQDPKFGPQDMWAGVSPFGWGFTSSTIASPGPLISVAQSELVELVLFSAGGSHIFYVDLNGDNVSSGEPESSTFSTAAGTPFSFAVAAPGSSWYKCAIHGWNQRGPFLVNPVIVNGPPAISFTAPGGGEVWTGGSTQAVLVVPSDGEDLLSALTYWVNFSATGSAPWTPFAGPLPGTVQPPPFSVPLADTVMARFNATVVDTGGLATSAISEAFAIDSTPPDVAAVSPIDTAPGVALNANIVLTFSEPMEEAVTVGATTVSPPPPSPTFNWNPTSTVLTISHGGLTASTTYSVTVVTSAEDISDPGNRLSAPFSSSFTTGTVADTSPPTILDVTVTPSPQESGLPVEIAANVTDNVSVGSVSAEVTRPDSSVINRTMTFETGTRWATADPWLQIGVHDYTIWALDASGNSASSTGSFTIVAGPDTTPPVITSVEAIPSPQSSGGTVQIQANVTDTSPLASVAVEVTRPDSTTTNLTMTATAGKQWVRSDAWTQVGTHSFVIWAIDASDNTASASGTFEITAAVDVTPPTITHTEPVGPFFSDSLIRITATVTDDDEVQEVRISFTDVTGANQNLTMTLGAGMYTFDLPEQGDAGTITYRLYAVDASGNSAATQEFTLTIQSRPSPGQDYTVPIAAAVIVALLLLLALLMLRRGKKPERETEP